ncbi:MAG: phosphoribosylformylglycinamidine synthase [Rickettsiaceae bacterium H1]|nr:phosphoribosylformylglycinamidine synthase [Rickettsiaceae bacterium H1]
MANNVINTKTFGRIEIYSDDYKSCEVYEIESDLDREQCLFIAQKLLISGDNWRLYFRKAGLVEEFVELVLNGKEVVHKGNQWLSGEITKYIKPADKITQISYLPGVTDSLASTVKKMIEQTFGYVFNLDDAVRTVKLFVGEDNYGYNPLIESCNVGTADEIHFIEDDSRDSGEFCEDEINKIELNQIEECSEKNSLGLSNKAITVIKEYFIKLGREPSYIELETLAQTWSEHCKHTIFASPIDDVKEGLYKTYIKGATEKIMNKKKGFCVSVFSDNAGAISFTEDWLIAVKVETHNSPSALEPFGGAMTGIVGVNRDIIGFGMGAKPVANMYGFCFAEPNKDYDYFRDVNCNKRILSPKEIIDGVIKGIEVGGNCSGIPTPQGFVFYDERFIAKPLVFAGTIGLIPRTINSKPAHEKKPKDGDYIVLIGGHTGRDGIHGANFSSDSLAGDNPASVVQIGDPITQKKLSDALIKDARDLGLYNAITDNGAGGLSSSIGEMGKCGFIVRLEKVPLKYQGMLPWEIWVSESQERMTLSVPPNKYNKLRKIMHKHDVSICTIGRFNNSGNALVTYNGKEILNLDTDFLHNGNPLEYLITDEIPDVIKALPDTKEINLQGNKFIAERYDHEVQGNLVLKPLQGKGKVFADATVIRPILDSAKGIALSQGVGMLLNDRLDPYYIAANAIDTAIRNAVVAGANPGEIALLDNFCWSDSTNPKRLWQLKRAAQACYDYAIAFNTPFISGKDSMFNDFKGYDIDGRSVHLTDPPTLLITAVGTVDDVTKCVSLDAKFSGDMVYLLGDNSLHDVDARKSLSLYKKIYEAINRDMIASAISVNIGGLWHAINRTELGGKLKIGIASGSQDMRKEYPGRILVTVNPDNKEKFEGLFTESVLIGALS